jgi:8-amino-7-oxononanoate synthase
MMTIIIGITFNKTSYSKDKIRMPALDDILQQRLHEMEAKHLRRSLHETSSEQGVNVMRDDKKYISFASNDYLGLSHHPEVIEAGKQALMRYGAGAGASRLVTGNHPLYATLEARLAQVKRTQAALVFGSGYLANLGVIASLMGKDDLIIADKLIHACMLDGAKLSGAKLLRFVHNDSQDAARLLAEHRTKFRHCLIMTETIFSMDGDLAPLDELLKLANLHDAWLMTDDAHGLYGQAKYPHPNHIQIGTLSKAIGAYGGYVCGTQTLIDYLICTARSFIFSTGLPPATIASAEKALTIVQQSPELCAKPLTHAQRFTHTLNLPLATSQIVPIIIGESDQAVNISKELEAQGFLISAIRPPTVPTGSARLRITFSAAHNQQEVEALAKTLKSLL